MDWRSQQNPCPSPNRNDRSVGICIYIFNIIILCAILGVSFLYYRDTNSQLNKLKILEDSVKEIMCELSEVKNFRQAKPITSQDKPAVPHSESGLCSVQFMKESLDKYTENLRKEISDTKKIVDQFIDSVKTRNTPKTDLQTVPINFATESLGAKIYAVNGPTLHNYDFLLRFFDLSFSNPPREILKSSMEPGNCYAFKGYKHNVTIQLGQETRNFDYTNKRTIFAGNRKCDKNDTLIKFHILGNYKGIIKSECTKVTIQMISVEHILDTMSPIGDISNAPKDFSVYGIYLSENKEENKEFHLGNFTYNIYLRQQLQYFMVVSLNCSTYAFKLVKFEFLTNNGNQNYTCVYRLGVHGKFKK